MLSPNDETIIDYIELQICPYKIQIHIPNANKKKSKISAIELPYCEISHHLKFDFKSQMLFNGKTDYTFYLREHKYKYFN